MWEWELMILWIAPVGEDERDIFVFQQALLIGTSLMRWMSKEIYCSQKTLTLDLSWDWAGTLCPRLQGYMTQCKQGRGEEHLGLWLILLNSVHLATHLSIHPSIHQSISSSTYSPIHQYIFPSTIHPSIHLPMHPPIRISTHLSTHLQGAEILRHGILWGQTALL